jgi:serine/threonine protein kinase
MPSPPDSADRWIGLTVADRYRIISHLGSGGMAGTYRAWDATAGVPVVIKIPRFGLLEDPRFAARFRREIHLLRELSHPHIVPIHGAGEHEGWPYVVMRFLPGGTLADRRLRDQDRRPLPNPPGMLHLWLPAVAEALDHAHAKGVVHRDVKPANIFFDADWNPCLGDFGIAKKVAETSPLDEDPDLTKTQMGIGTLDYMAPEQFSGGRSIDGRADQYALAVVVYEIVAGIRPFHGAGEMAALIAAVLTQPAPSLAEACPRVPPTLFTAVHRGLAKKPEDRFPSCRAFATAALAGVPRLEGEPEVARLLCPQCGWMLVLPRTAGGRTGNCPKCRGAMAVAFDMSALWLLEEAGSARSTRGVELDQDVDWEILEESVTDVFNAPPPPSPPGLGRWLPSGLRRFLRRFGIG